MLSSVFEPINEKTLKWYVFSMVQFSIYRHPFQKDLLCGPVTLVHKSICVCTKPELEQIFINES